MRVASGICAIALLLITVPYRPAGAAAGDVIAASDFRLGTQGWSLAGSGWSSDGIQSEGDLIAAVDSPSTPGNIWYYSAPTSFIAGDKALAYNGFLSFDFGHFEYESMGQGTTPGYDIMLYGKNKKQTLGLKGVFQIDETKLSQTYHIRLEETFKANNSVAMWELVNVVKPVDGKLVTKAPTQHEFLKTLQGLTGIWIRGSYFAGSEATWLKNVKIVRGVITKGSAAAREDTSLVNGVTSSVPATSPAGDTGCCSSRTCVTNDYYEIDFDRPGCMQSPDYQCYMPQSVDTIDKQNEQRYFKTYDKSSAAQIIRGTDYNEGRPFMLPGTVSPCWGAGAVSPTKSACAMAGQNPGTAPYVPAISGESRWARWESATKNQNIGSMGIPIRKPFVKDYYMNSLPKICSAATLTVSVHGDIADPLDYIEVYGEDEEYLGKLFAGNLTYMYEGQRPYDANTDLWDCDGPYDPSNPSTATNVRLADPHMPGGTWPKVRGFRGGVDAQPGVYGKEDTKCVKWQYGGERNPTLQHSESMPYVDSIVIPAEKMMAFTADEQMKLTFRTWRNGAVSNVFTGTGGGGVTGNCFHSKGANSCGTGVRCDGCDLDGKVLFRSMKIKFSTAACFVKKLATDKMEVFQEGIHTTQPLNVSLNFNVPVGATGMPGGDAALSVTVGADIFGRESFISVYTKAGVKVGDLFRQQSSGSLVSRTSGDMMVQTTSFGATDAPIPFRTATDCDTTSPITKTDFCTPADNQWTMGDTFVNYTDTIIIPRSQIASLSVDGKVELYLTSDVPGNAFSPSSGGGARISPITLSFPLLHCFQKAIKTGPQFGIYLERPRHYYFHQTGFPVPAGDVTIFFAAHWNRHVRYVTRHVGPAAATAANAYDGLQDGLSVTRVDKDTVSEMGTVWVYKDQVGTDCCPATHRPDFAGKRFPVPADTNCIGGTCVDPDLSELDNCRRDSPCATSVLAGWPTTTATIGTLRLDTGAVAANDVYVGLKIVFGVELNTASIGNPSGQAGFGCSKVSQTGLTCIISGGGGVTTGYRCTYNVDADGVVNTVAVALNPGPHGHFESSPAILPAFDDSCEHFSYNVALSTTELVAGDVGEANAKTILTYAATNREVTIAAVATGTPPNAVAKVGYRITGEGVTTFPKNSLQGGTATGAVVVPLSSEAQCQTRYIATGYIEVLDSTSVYARLDAGMATANNNAYKDMTIEVLSRGTGGAGAGSWEARTITAYTGTVSGTIAGTGAQSTLTSVVLGGAFIAAPVAGYNHAYMRPSVLGTPTLRGLSIEIDIDGNVETGDDVYTREITSYTQATGVITFATLPAGMVPKDGVSTAKIETRVATLASAIAISSNDVASISTPVHSKLVTPARPTFASNVAAGTGQVQLNILLSPSDNILSGLNSGNYNGHKIIITHAATGNSYEYTIVDYSPAAALPDAIGSIAGVGGAWANLDKLLVEAVTTSDTYTIYRPYRIYKRLSPSGSETCLVASDLRVTYTIGNAATVSNEAGELDTIYSNWDRSTGNAYATGTSPPRQTGIPSTADVRSWLIKLTGEGYLTEYYRQQGVGAFTTTSLASLTNVATTVTVTSTAGMSSGMFLNLFQTGSIPASAGPSEIVKVRAVTSATTLEVYRAQMGTTAAAFVSSTVVTPVGNNVDGSGYDDLAAFGGTSRRTITVDDAYTGLNITILSGTGAGQSRVIGAYHGASRTAYVTKAWDIIPDATSRYEIWYAALIGGVEKPCAGGTCVPAAMNSLAIATFPRPIRKGYLWRIEWFDCAKAEVNSLGASGDHNSNSLPQCPGSLRMRIPKQGPPTDYSLTSMLNSAQSQIFYTMREVDITRQEYPEMIEEHKQWPHGYNYLKLMAGEDGEHLGNVFLKDYTQYSTLSYYTDTLTIPAERFANYVRQNGDFTFTLATPPGRGNIELRSIAISYPVLKESDANTYDAADFPETTPLSSHGPPPFFPQSVGWSGADEVTRTPATHPRFQTHSYTSTCGNGLQDGAEYCDDGNEVDGDGCSSSCTQEVGWNCVTPFTDQPSTCELGAQGSRIADPSVGCKYYACESSEVGYNKGGTVCSGKVMSSVSTATTATFANGATTFTVTSATGLYKGHFLRLVDAVNDVTETVSVVSVVGSTFTVLRARLGTTQNAGTFPAGTLVFQALSQPEACLDTTNSIMGTCSLCVGWGNDAVNNQLPSYAGRTAYRR